MFRGARSVLAAPLLAAFFSGCLAEETAPLELPHDHGTAMAMAGWSVQLENCQEGGFVAVYNMMGKYVVEPWERYDIRKEVGNPRMTSLALPLVGEATGHWHQGIRCAAAATADGDEPMKDFQLGYVGVMVKAPPWDPGGADLHLLLAGFGFQESPVRDSLLEVTTAEITRSKESRTTWYGPAAVYAVYDDVEKGTYDSYSAVVKYRDVPERTIRFWWVVPADGSRAKHDHHEEAADGFAEAAKGFHPVYWDLHTTGGAQHTTPDSVALGCHRGTDAHGPQGGLCQHILTNLYHHKSLTITYGGVIEDVTLNQEWIH